MALCVTDDAIERIREVRQYAESNPYTLEQMLERVKGTLGAPGDDPQFVADLAPNVRCVYSIETNEQRMTIRTLSVSKRNSRNLPTPLEVEMLLPLFGFASRSIIEATTTGALIVRKDTWEEGNALVVYERMLH